MTTIKLKTIFSFALLFFFSLANAQYAESSWKLTANLNSIGLSNFVEYDYDNDNIQEIIFTSNDYNNSLLKILDYQGGQYKEVYSSTLFTNVINWMEKYDFDGDGNYHLYLATSDAAIEVWDLSNMQAIDTINLSFTPRKFYLTDVENDGTFEIVASSNSTVYLLDHEGNILLQKAVPSLDDIAIGNIDGVGPEEIIATGTDGFILNLADFSEAWTFLGGFGQQLYLKDVDGAGKSLIYGAENYDFITCFDGELHTPLWQLNVDDQITEIEIHDINGDGSYELLVGKDWDFNGIECYKLSDQSLLWQMGIPNDGITDFSMADFDGDGALEITYGCGHTISSEDLMVIIDPNTQTEEWRSTDFSGGFSFDLGDLNNDEVLDYFIASESTNSNYDGGVGFIYNGLDKSILSGPFNPTFWDDIIDVSVLFYEDIHYLLFVFDNRLIIYNYENDTEVVNEYLGFSNVKFGGFYQAEEDAIPQVFTCKNNGQVDFYDFAGNVLTSSWSTIASGSNFNDYRIGNFDTDAANEIAIMLNSVVSIYDLNTHFLQSQFSIPNSTTRTFEIADLNADGNKDILFYNDNSHLGLIDISTSALTEIPIEETSIKAIRVENMDLDTDLEFAILSEDRLSIYDHEGTLLFASKNINYNNFSSFSSLEIADIDNDQHMELIAATQYGVFEYKVSSEYLDVKLPTVKSHLPLDGTNLLSTNTNFEVTFSEVMATGNIDDQILVTNEANEPLLFTTSFDPVLKKLTITPQTIWTPGNEITITLKNEMTDPTGNNLDGNNNGVPNGIDDDYSWSVSMGTDIDLSGPEVKNLSIPGSVFQGAPIQLSGYATDSSMIAVSTVSYIEYFVDQVVVPGNGTPLPAFDETFDEVTEDFIGKVSTGNLDYGDHTVSVIARDALGNWGIATEVTFNIIEEDPANWTQYSYDLLNTGANTYAEIDLPLTIKYELDESAPITRSIVVEDYLIYTISSSSIKKLICRNVHTGDLIWQHEYDLSDDIYPAAYAYGYVYAQLGDHSNSKLACYDLLTGDEIWVTDYSTQWMDAYGPIVYGDKVYIVEGDYSSAVGAYDAFTGELVWMNDINGSDNYDEWQPAFYQDTLYGYAEILGALNPNTGGTYYSVDDPDQIPFSWSGWTMNASTVIDTLNRQLILTSRNYTHAFSLDTQEVVWSITSSEFGNFSATPALYDGKLYVASEYLSELDVTNGQVLWQHDFDLSSFNGYQPAVNDNILAVSNGYSTLIFDRNTHELKINIDEEGEVMLSRDYLIHSSWEGKLRVFEYDANPAPLSGSIEITQPISCFGNANGSIQVDVLGGSPPYTYDWNVFASNTNTLSNLFPNTYSVTVTDQSFNSIDFSIELTQPTLLALGSSFVSDINNEGNGSATVTPTGGTAPYSYLWSHDNSVNTPTAENLTQGMYTVTVTDNNGCQKNITVTVDNITGVHEVAPGKNLTIFPTLTTESIYIQSEVILQNVDIEIFNLSGQQVYFTHAGQFEKTTINLADLNSGYYLVHISNQDFSINEKIVLVNK